MVEILFGGGDFYARAIYTIPQKSNGGQECLDGGKTDHGWSSRTPSLPFLTKKNTPSGGLGYRCLTLLALCQLATMLCKSGASVSRGVPPPQSIARAPLL